MHSRLVYVMGPSGSGKDSLLHYVRSRLTAFDRAVVAHRYITRPVLSEGENHIALSDGEFDMRLKSGLLAMHWQAHGLRYGIGIEINHWLALGITVIVNGSREYFPQLQQRYPEVYPVCVQVEPETLRQRLTCRGREDAAHITERIVRNDAFQFRMEAGAQIDNNGPLEKSGEHFLGLIQTLSKAST